MARSFMFEKLYNRTLRRRIYVENLKINKHKFAYSWRRSHDQANHTIACGGNNHWMGNHAFLKLEDNKVRLCQQRGGLLLLLQQQLWAQLRAQQVLGELLVRPRELETRGPGEL